jgi:hypothetical protein
VHTGHILYGVFATGASSQIKCLAATVDGATKVAEIIAVGLPEELLRLRNPGASFSKAYVSTLEHSILNARARASQSISVSDLLKAILATEPNVATHVLTLLAINRDDLNRELDEGGSH